MSGFKIYNWLKPAACLYGMGSGLRNMLFERGWLRSRSYPVPLIGVGNITVGGTGKSPHTDYLIRLLGPGRRLAVVSRGYRRKSRGLVVADRRSTADDIGDEPWDMLQRHPEIQVAVCARRVEAVDALLAQPDDRRPEVILLDDCYQHRHVKPSLNILLTNYHRLMTRDLLLPAGRLRERVGGKRRADIIVVTKCPPHISAGEMQAIVAELQPDDGQQVYFSCQAYRGITRMQTGRQLPMETLRTCPQILLLTGIATPDLLASDLAAYNSNIVTMAFPDHHAFTPADGRRISQWAESAPDALLLTTDKDAARLRLCPSIPDSVASRICTIDMQVDFVERKDEFDAAVRRCCGGGERVV